MSDFRWLEKEKDYVLRHVIEQARIVGCDPGLWEDFRREAKLRWNEELEVQIAHAESEVKTPDVQS